TSAFEPVRGYLPPPKPLNGLKLAALLYDLIPGLFEQQYLPDSAAAATYYQALETVRRYDLLLAISEASRLDACRIMGLPPSRVHSISAAADSRFFCPDSSQPPPPEAADLLVRLGVRQPFVYCLAALDYRKNVLGLVAAFQRLPCRLRQSHQLVLTCSGNEPETAALVQSAEQAGIADALVLTGTLDDVAIRTLYRRCAAFVFPSRYEGFGLPVLEAMLCGAAVIAGNNSSQIEVVGDAGLLADVDDPADLAGQIARLLDDAPLAARLRRQAPLAARRFRWEDTADRCQAAMVGLFGSRRRPLKPRLAWFSPLPPDQSPAADYAARLLEELSRRFTIDLFHEPGYVPHVAIASPCFACHDYRLFSRYSQALAYQGILYQVDNACRQPFVLDSLGRQPGLVVLHRTAGADGAGQVSGECHAPAGGGDRLPWICERASGVILLDPADYRDSRDRYPHFAQRMHCIASDLGWPATAQRFAELLDASEKGDWP
ncbi:MAG: glycosyltransferase family 1 protein, partial [Pirellulales bacterium]